MKTWIYLILAFALPLSVSAQYCSPTGNCVFGDFVNDFEINTLSNLGSGGSNCGTNFNPGPAFSLQTQTTSLTQGVRYAVFAQGRTGGNVRAQGFAVWIDYNHDGDFDDAGEFAAASPAATRNLYIDSITIPINATLGTTRLRVRSLRGSTISSNQSCTAFNRGETEDYVITIAAAPGPPLTDFTANATTTCSGVVQFTDLTPNVATSWLWDFGDGDTSHQQNPSHTYTTSGTYTVELTATNSFGSKKETKTNYMTVNLGSGPVSASCSPSTSTSSRDFGITSFSFIGLTQTSPDATAGYEDYSCNQAVGTKGLTYRMVFGSSSAPANQSYRAWIDFNGDGVFSNPELVLSQDNAKEANQQITLPAGSVTGTPLRIRVAAVYFLSAPAGSAYNSCATLQNGQMEDYNVLINPNTNAPLADFEANPTKSCSGTVQFNDNSTNVPTGWTWDFGDGNGSNLQSPSHTYANDGTYDVKLKVTNSFGADSVTKTGVVTVDKGALVKSACAVNTVSHIDDYGIQYVIFNTINNLSLDGREGYQDYSCSHQTVVDPGTTYTIEVKTGSNNREDVRVWIDYDNSGTFSSSEEVAVSLNDSLHRETITIPNNTTLNTFLRMRVSSDIVGNTLTACTDPTYGQTEDYGIYVKSTTTPAPPLADFVADSTESCTGEISFTDQTSGVPTQWEWDFGDGNKSNAQNPKHGYAGPGTYTVSLKATNSMGTDTETKTGYITVDNIFCGRTSVETNTLERNVTVYPNPSNGKFNVEFHDLDVKKYTIRVLSLQGQVIYLNAVSSNNNKLLEVNLSSTPAGMYLMIIESEGQTAVKRLTIDE